MNTLTTDEIAMLDEPNTCCSSRLQISWKISPDAPETKNATNASRAAAEPWVPNIEQDTTRLTRERSEPRGSMGANELCSAGGKGACPSRLLTERFAQAAERARM